MPTPDAAHDPRRAAHAWIAAWNRHDLDAVMEHYAEDVVFRAATVVTRWNRDDGTLHGRAALRAHFAKGLALAPRLRFELEDVLLAPGGYAVVYRRENGNRVVVRLARGAALPASLRTVRHATALLSVESVLAHGDLLAARRAAGPEAVLADRLARLTAALSRDLRAAAERGAEPTASQRRLAERIRLGAAAAASRSHTSRAFHHATGETLSGYRRRLRVAAAVRAIASGDDVFARVAAEAGFADHAHLSRTLLAATGSTPTQLRRRFRAGAGQG